MGKINFNRLNHTVKSWHIGDYFRQFSIVAAGIIVTFWGSDRITENARQKEVRATMQLVTEELEYNRQELRNIKHLLDIDIHMSLLLREHDMDVSKIPTDTLWKYGKLFNNMDEFSYRTDALDVLKGSSLMQYIPDKRMLQDVLQTYFELGRKQKDVSDYYATKTDALMSAAMSRELANVFDGGGMYFICITENFSVNYGDMIILACACFFALHIITIERFSVLVDGVRMSLLQFAVCGILSLPAIFFYETPSWEALDQAWLPILYAGIMSCGIAYTLQILGQKYVNVILASIILSMESVFSVFAGWLLLGEQLSLREIGGCVLVFAAILLAQMPPKQQ